MHYLAVLSSGADTGANTNEWNEIVSFIRRQYIATVVLCHELVTGHPSFRFYGQHACQLAGVLEMQRSSVTEYSRTLFRKFRDFLFPVDPKMLLIGVNESGTEVTWHCKALTKGQPAGLEALITGPQASLSEIMEFFLEGMDPKKGECGFTREHLMRLLENAAKGTFYDGDDAAD